MITIDDILKAIRMLDDLREWLNCEGVHKQIAKSLELYRDRLEFNGTLDDAIECLQVAGYEIGGE